MRYILFLAFNGCYSYGRKSDKEDIGASKIDRKSCLI